MPLLSVIVPARNAEDHIGTALRSTLRALPDDSEIVVMDDGSSDSTAERIASIGDSRIRVMTHSTSQGVANSLNELIEATDSRYVARMDADDIVLPGRFRAQLRAVHHRADVIFSGIIDFGSGYRVPKPSIPLALPPERMRLALLFGNPLCHSTMLAPRSALLAVGGYRVCAAEDYDLWLRLAADGQRITRLRRPTVAYRHHATQVTAAEDWARSALAEPQIRESYSALAHDVLGVTPDDDRFEELLAERISSSRGALYRRFLEHRASLLTATAAV
jgi:glycosyltransferase involved in cell wall biosynthesis